MKKFRIILILLASICMSGCSDNRYTLTTNEGTIVEVESNQFCDLVIVCKGCMPYGSITIYCDKNTGVLYMGRDNSYHFGISPIMKADGTCLTLKEFNENNSKE